MRRRPRNLYPLDTRDWVMLGLFIVCLIVACIFSPGCGGPAAPTTCSTCQPPASPTPTPEPSACPTPPPPCYAGQWKIGLRECKDVIVGDTCLIDTTALMVGGRCNSEGSEGCPPNACGRRECEPPESDGGPVLEVLSGFGAHERVVRNDDNKYQFRFVKVTGRVRFSVCWPDDAKDHDGVLLDQTHATCDVATIEPREPTFFEWLWREID